MSDGGGWPVKDLTIASVEAIACSVPLKQAVTQGLGSVTKRDTVVVKVTTGDGLVGYGESYNGRAPLAVAATIDTTLRDLLTGLDAAAPDDVPQRLEPIAAIEACHSVAGDENYILKVRVASPLALEDLLQEIRAVAGVSTRTTIVLSTPYENRPPGI